MRLFFLLSLLVITNIAMAKTDVPLKARQSFASHYADPAHIKWEEEKGNYEVNFQYHKQHMSVLYDKEGNTLQTEVRIASGNLPDDARHYAEKKGHIKEASEITLATDAVQYEAEVNGVDLIFDASGKYLSEEKEK